MMSTREQERAEFLALTRPRAKKPNSSLSSPFFLSPREDATPSQNPQPGYFLNKEALARYESARDSQLCSLNASGVAADRSRKFAEDRSYSGPNTKPEMEQEDECLMEQDFDFPAAGDLAVGATVYDNYSFEVNDPRISNLPVTAMKEEILKTVSENSVTIIKGETGSGKSTQVPYFILEQCAAERRHCNIICTLPRRIAVTSVAKFVCDSHGWRLGTLVGYQIAMDKIVSDDTKLTYVTTGVLLQKLIAMKNMNQFTHVILDEVHERDQDTDFALLLVRKLLKSNSKRVKVILMSATLEGDVLASYFGRFEGDKVVPAPVVVIAEKPYSVMEFYLDDIAHLGQCGSPDPDFPRISEEATKMACTLICEFDNMEQKNPKYRLQGFTRGTVLVFLPGMPEIEEMDRAIKNYCEGRNLTVLPLHSTISGDQQYQVFLRPEEGKRKVILATNIAESAITVPDIDYVIDFCLVKELVCDHSTNFQSLRLTWASKSSMTQRQGRAGRVRDGKCYRLITRDFYCNHTLQYSIPEMQRAPLENVILHVKKLDLGEPCSILSLALQPPNLFDIQRAIVNLKEIGALSVTMDGKVNPSDGDLTFLGHVLAELPINVTLGKLIMLGHVFGYLEECMVIAASLSQKSFFIKRYQEEMSAYRAKVGWTYSSASDCMAYLHAYKDWYFRKDSGQFRNDRAELDWCIRNFIKKTAINEVAELVKDLSTRLTRQFNINISKKLVTRATCDGGTNVHDTLMLKVVMAGAFYPSYFKWAPVHDEMSHKILSGHDPTTTVMLSGFPPHAELYAGAVVTLFSDIRGGKALHFEGSKVFLEFERNRSSQPQALFKTSDFNVDSNVLDAVNLALKKRHFRNKPLMVYTNEKATLGLLEMGELDRIKSIKPTGVSVQTDVLLSRKELVPITLPSYGTHQITITEVISAGSFWAHFSDVNAHSDLAELMESIGTSRYPPLLLPPSSLPGHYCLAKYSEDGLYYRALIDSISNVGDNMVQAQVWFVDYGNSEVVSLDDLCELPPELCRLPMMAFECHLKGIRPNPAVSPDGKWTMEASIRLQQLAAQKRLYIDVYSNTNSILRGDLYDTTGQHDTLINQVLVDEGFAVHCNEPSISELAHQRGNQLRIAVEKTQRRQLDTEGAQSAAVGAQGAMGMNSIHTTVVPWSQGLRHMYTSMQISGKYPKHTVGNTPITPVALKGPNSPYEVAFYSLTAIGSMCPVRVEKDSVNAIVVNSEPQDEHERMMFAPNVQLSSNTNTILVRDVTLMPNIHGLIHIVSILFAPVVEMRTDELRRQYTGAICGLGFDPVTGLSLYPDHDIELTFDTLFTQQDLRQINGIRSAICLAIGSEAVSQWGESATRQIQEKARELLRGVLLKPRESVTKHPHQCRGWNQVSPEHILVPEGCDEGPLPLYPLHNGVVISEQVLDKHKPPRVMYLRVKMKELHRLASLSRTPNDHLLCELCNIKCRTPHELLLHLQEKMHTIKEAELYVDDPL